MKIGYFSDGKTSFVGAVFEDRTFNLSLAASRAGTSPLVDLASLLREERFDRSLFEDIYNRGKDWQECWHPLKNLSFLPRGRDRRDRHSQESCKRNPVRRIN